MELYKRIDVINTQQIDSEAIKILESRIEELKNDRQSRGLPPNGKDATSRMDDSLWDLNNFKKQLADAQLFHTNLDGFKPAGDISYDPASPLKRELDQILKPLKVPRNIKSNQSGRFYFTEYGWMTVGQEVARFYKSIGIDFRIKVLDDVGNRTIKKVDKYQVLVFPNRKLKKRPKRELWKIATLKLFKTANGRTKMRMSKGDWLRIGYATQWIKMASEKSSLKDMLGGIFSRSKAEPKNAIF